MQTQRTRIIAAVGVAFALGMPSVRVMAQGAQPTITAQPAPSYILAPEDVLDISVAGHEELKSSVTILTDGTINFPQVGIVHASGKTIEALQKVIAKGLS